MVGGKAGLLLVFGGIDPHPACRIDDRPGPDLVQRTRDRAFVGKLELAAAGEQKGQVAFGGTAGERLAQRSARTDDQQRPAV